MTTIASPDQRYLAGPLAPVPDEITAVDLAVTGRIPTELAGRYLRNGPNPLPGTDSGHWFAGSGMLHGLSIKQGRAEWYRNRWVRTNELVPGSTPTVPGCYGQDLAANPANTHIIEHGGALLALCEGGLPYEMTAELDTVGAYDFGGRLRTAMTAHPKTDPATGELFFYGYSPFPPFVTFHVADAAGNLTQSFPVEVPGPTMMHDFAITEHHVVWLDLPVTFDLARGAMPYGWNDSYGARVGVMARAGGPVRWFEIDPCYVFHVGNASEDSAGRITLDAVRYAPEDFLGLWSGIGSDAVEHLGGPAAHAAQASTSVLYRWVLDPGSGTVTETPLGDRDVEFPSINDVHVGLANRYLYTVSASYGGQLIKFDTDLGTHSEHQLSVPSQVGEAVFVPTADARAEDEGWLICVTTPQDGGASDLLILDASEVAAEPVATVHLPRRVPAGFHGSWIPDHDHEEVH